MAPQQVKFVLRDGTLLHACLLQGERLAYNPAALQQSIDCAGRLSIAVSIEHGLNITLKRPLLCVAWRVLPSVYKLDNRDVNASRNGLAHQE